jgi:hypothetical protein
MMDHACPCQNKDDDVHLPVHAMSVPERPGLHLRMRLLRSQAKKTYWTTLTGLCMEIPFEKTITHRSSLVPARRHRRSFSTFIRHGFTALLPT